jgi:class 3 adenylate cyclase
MLGTVGLKRVMDSPGVIPGSHRKLDTATGLHAGTLKSFMGDGIAALFRIRASRARRCV